MNINGIGQSFFFLIQSLAWSVVSFVTIRPNWGWGTVVMWCAGLFVPRIDACAVSKKTFTYTTRIQGLGAGDYVNKERDKHYYVYCACTYYYL